jgi:uncharacterized membrane protein YvbJ
MGNNMNKCSVCGHEDNGGEIKCTACGHFYSKIAEIIAEQEALEELQTFKGQCKRILGSDNVKQALLTELKQMWLGLSTKGRFALFVIFVFVFALIVTVL